MKLLASYEFPYKYSPKLAAFEVRDGNGDVVIEGDINGEHAKELHRLINAPAPSTPKDGGFNPQDHEQSK